MIGLWVLYATWEGLREAGYWHIKGVRITLLPFHEHIEWSIQRSVVLAMAFFTSDWVTVVCFMFMFPFFHDGAYYARRHYYNPKIYPKRFWDQSTTSTAVLTKFFTPLVRTLCAVAGISIYIYIT